VRVAFALRALRSDEHEWFYATRLDAFRVYAEQVFGPWEEERQRAAAERDCQELPIEVVERDGERIGYQIILRHVDHWFLDEIALIASARGAGIGTALVAAIMDGAKAAGMPLRLSVLHVNPAQRLYERLGFYVTRIEHPRVKMEWPRG
jgi:ribosomal protein S18 acetylase RimI-like enzyme